jgi:hypothetical protein
MSEQSEENDRVAGESPVLGARRPSSSTRVRWSSARASQRQTATLSTRTTSVGGTSVRRSPSRCASAAISAIRALTSVSNSGSSGCSDSPVIRDLISASGRVTQWSTIRSSASHAGVWPASARVAAASSLSVSTAMSSSRARRSGKCRTSPPGWDGRGRRARCPQAPPRPVPSSWPARRNSDTSRPPNTWHYTRCPTRSTHPWKPTIQSQVLDLDDHYDLRRPSSIRVTGGTVGVPQLVSRSIRTSDQSRSSRLTTIAS